jgi:hypothetical protein
VKIFSRKKQTGAVLILIAFIIGLVAVSYLVKSLDAQKIRIAQDKKTYQSLNAAKKALIAYAISQPLHPGQMPFPDRNDDPELYDGKSDCNSPGSTFNYNFLIGQLPIYGKTNPCIAPQEALDGDFRDAQGYRLWYAVSRNLTHKYETYPVIIDPVTHNPVNDFLINPSVIGDPRYKWLKVLDKNGNVVSDRVAAVIIAPGNPLPGQTRADNANANQFLDSLKIGSVIYKNYNYDVQNEDFIMGEDSHNVSFGDPTYATPYNFNDKLVYITIDELMTALVTRAAAEIKPLLKSYFTKAGQYPYAADLGSSLDNYSFVLGQKKGMLPIDVTDSCECSSFQSCTCPFTAVNSVTFTRGSGNWSGPTGSATSLCARSASKCTCTGAGSCTKGSIYFTCDNAGNCDTNDEPSNTFTFVLPSYSEVFKPSLTCAYVPADRINCTDEGKFEIGLKETSWFKQNLWQDYFYYEWSPTNNIQVGAKAGVSAILIGTGAPIKTAPFAFNGTQLRPSANISDYLDSQNNTNGDSTFEAINQQKAKNFNDQTYIVAP